MRAMNMNKGAAEMRYDVKRVAFVLTVWVIAAGYPAAALAQVDLSGGWAARQHEDAPERGGGPDMGEFQGLPINAADRMRGDSWSSSLWTVPEHQCIPHPADYNPNFSTLVMSKDVDPVSKEITAWHTEFSWMNPIRTIWMDGRPHPPAYAAHTWQGFSTGKWEGDMLTVETTHLKPAYIRRDGLARSEKATVREHFIRNGNILTLVTIVNDPVYLTEPYIKSRNFWYDPGYQMTVYSCSVDIEIDRPAGVIPHYLPGANPFLSEWAAKNHLPLEAARGGAETMYPEFMIKIRTMPSAKMPAAPPPAPTAAKPAAKPAAPAQGNRR
jgi:hypothetical protein